MSTPTPTKTWLVTQQRLYARGSGLAASQQALRAIKTALMTSDGWICTGSQTAGGGGMDGVDRWTTDGALKWGNPSTDAVSAWIALRKLNAAGTGKHLDLLLHLSSSTSFGTQVDELGWYWGAGGTYFGGTATARPTYIGGQEVAALVAADWRDNGTADFSAVLTVVRAADGSGVRVFLLDSNRVVCFLSVESVATPSSGWTHPVAVTRTTGAPSAGQLVGTGSTVLFDARAGDARWFSAAWLAEGYATSVLSDGIRYANQITGGPAHVWALSPVAVASSVAGKCGRHGDLVDVYLAPAHLPIGLPFPLDAPPSWVKLGDLVVPWDGSPVYTV